MQNAKSKMNVEMNVMRTICAFHPFRRDTHVAVQEERMGAEWGERGAEGVLQLFAVAGLRLIIFRSRQRKEVRNSIDARPLQQDIRLFPSAVPLLVLLRCFAGVLLLLAYC